MTKARPLPDAEYLKTLFRYDPETGHLYWLQDRAQMKTGDIAGHQGFKDGRYVRISVDKKIFRGHLLIWKMMTGQDPSGPIDHINAIKNDNRWSNLRLASKSLNQANVGLIKSNTSGVKGVRWYKAYGRWVSQFTKDGKCYFVGYFDDFEEAKLAFQKRYCEVYGEFARFE